MININNDNKHGAEESNLHQAERIGEFFTLMLVSASYSHDAKLLRQVECVNMCCRPIRKPAHAAWNEAPNNRESLSITINANNSYPLKKYRTCENRPIYDADALLFDAYAHAIARHIDKYRPTLPPLGNDTAMIDAMLFQYRVKRGWSVSPRTIDRLWGATVKTRNALATYRLYFPDAPLPEQLERRLYYPEEESGCNTINREDAMSAMCDPIRSLEL